jgi:hypothetical protein
VEHLIPGAFTPEESEQIEKVFNDSRAQVNRHLQELAGLPFRFLTNFDMKKFEEAEKIMGEMSTASVALTAWNEIRPHLDEFENPIQAMIAGLMLVDKKFKVIQDLTKEEDEKA